MNNQKYLQINPIMCIVLGNNTPQAYVQSRLITAQIEGLLVSGEVK